MSIVTGAPEGYEGVNQFAARVGVGRGLIYNLIAKSVLAKEGAFLHIKNSLAAYAAWDKVNPDARRGETPEGYENVKRFAARTGVDCGTINNLIAKGVIVKEGAFLHIENSKAAYVAWDKANPNAARGKTPGGYEGVNQFAARVGTSRCLIENLIARGVLAKEGAFLHIGNSLAAYAAWGKANPDARRGERRC
jgi:hypothetical protein